MNFLYIFWSIYSTGFMMCRVCLCLCHHCLSLWNPSGEPPWKCNEIEHDYKRFIVVPCLWARVRFRLRSFTHTTSIQWIFCKAQHRTAQYNRVQFRAVFMVHWICNRAFCDSPDWIDRWFSSVCYSQCLPQKSRAHSRLISSCHSSFLLHTCLHIAQRYSQSCANTNAWILNRH